jgi:hypothetical protein
LVVTTDFSYVGETGGLKEVPGWPWERYFEQPIGIHDMVSVTRVP